MICRERRDERLRVHRVARDNGSDDNATTEWANTSIALHVPLALDYSDLTDRKQRVEQPGAPHSAGTAIEIANLSDVLGPKPTNNSVRRRIGRGSGQHRLMLVDLSIGHEAELLVETKALARRIENDRASVRLTQQFVHQPSSDPSALQRRRHDDHAERSEAVLVRPPQRRRCEPFVGLDRDPVAEPERESPVVLAIRPVQRCGKRHRRRKMVRAQRRDADETPLRWGDGSHRPSSRGRWLIHAHCAPRVARKTSPLPNVTDPVESSKVTVPSSRCMSSMCRYGIARR